jgi:hypothetical protein
MHADLSADVQAHPAMTREEQQRALSKWQKEFNHVRPHEALGGKVPAEVYKPSVRRRLDVPAFAYPKGWLRRNVIGKDGVFSLEGQNYFVGRAFIDHTIALEPLGGLQHRMWFRDIDLGLVELVPPRRMIDSAVDAFLARPFHKPPRSSSANSQLASLPPRPPQLPLDTCSQQTLGSSAVSSAASVVQSA